MVRVSREGVLRLGTLTRNEERKREVIMSKPETQPPSLGVIDEVDAVGLKVTVLKAAMELDVFTTISKGHVTLEEIATVLQCSMRGMRVLLDALCPLGLLHRENGTYTLTPTAETYLVEGVPTYCGAIYLTWFQGRERFADCVRTGKPAIDLTIPEAEDLWVSYTAPYLILWPELAETARTRWEAVGVNAETLPGAHILDVACGSGVKSFVLAQADVNARVTAVDSPKVLEVTANIADAMGVATQVIYQSGDVLTMDLGTEQFDIVLLGNILHYFPPSQMQALLCKTHQALKPGGLVVIDDGVLDEERGPAEDVLLAAVEMVNSAPYAEFHTFSEYKGALESAGFTQVALHGTRPVSARK
jgi:SAM-dependent methyltransferase